MAQHLKWEVVRDRLPHISRGFFSHLFLLTTSLSRDGKNVQFCTHVHLRSYINVNTKGKFQTKAVARDILNRTWTIKRTQVGR